MTRKRDFLLWEMVALFFVLTYTEVMGMIGSASTLELVTAIIIQWVWIVSALLSLGLGLMCLNPRNSW